MYFNSRSFALEHTVLEVQFLFLDSSGGGEHRQCARTEETNGQARQIWRDYTGKRKY